MPSLAKDSEHTKAMVIILSEILFEHKIARQNLYAAALFVKLLSINKKTEKVFFPVE